MALISSNASNCNIIKSRRVAPYATRDRNRGSGNLITDINVSGTISGIVKIANVSTAGIVVRLYRRDNGLLIDQAITSATGSYSFVGLENGSPDLYYVVFMDPATGSPYNYTVCRDHLTAG